MRIEHTVQLKISQLAFYQHHNPASVYPPWTEQTTLSAKHTLVHLLVCAGVLSPTHQGMHLTEVKRGQIARRAACRA